MVAGREGVSGWGWCTASGERGRGWYGLAAKGVH